MAAKLARLPSKQALVTLASAIEAFLDEADLAPTTRRSVVSSTCPVDREAGAHKLRRTCDRALGPGREMPLGAEADPDQVAQLTLSAEVAEVDRTEGDWFSDEAHDQWCLDHPFHRSLGPCIGLGQKEAPLGREVVHGQASRGTS